MTKRRFVRWSLLLAILAAFAVWLEPTRVVWGWLRGEAFYQGRPTSYWRGDYDNWTPWFNCAARPGPDGRLWLVHESAWMRKFSYFSLDRWLGRPRSTEIPPLLQGDPQAMPVLRELLHDPLLEVQAFAQEGLDNIRKAGETK
jgi:hypothetical protein